MSNLEKENIPFNIENSPDSERSHNLEILWRPAGAGAQILRVFGHDLEVVIPDTIEGRLVTEVGPYCFSASDRCPKEGVSFTHLGQGVSSLPEYFPKGVKKDSPHCHQEPTMPAICGNYVESITLPDTVTTLHNAAFYNCRKLHTLSVGPNIQSIGSDEFMNCHKLVHLLVRSGYDEKNGVGLILERITTDIEVTYQPVHLPEMNQAPNQPVHLPGTEQTSKCVLFFPEYYEWLNEISPAHIFSRTVEGEGLRMRKAFQGKVIDLGKYDQCFDSTLMRETDDNIVHIAWNRLRYPHRLSEEMKRAYEEAIRARYDVVIKRILKQREIDQLEFLCGSFDPGQELLAGWMEKCILEEWSEGAAFLMEKKRKQGSFAEKSFDFGDFDDLDF